MQYNTVKEYDEELSSVDIQIKELNDYKTKLNIEQADDEISSVDNQIKELNDYKTKLNIEQVELLKDCDLEIMMEHLRY